MLKKMGTSALCYVLKSSRLLQMFRRTRLSLLSAPTIPALLAMEDPSKPCSLLSSDLKQAVFKVVLKTGGKEEFEAVKSLIDVSDNIADKKLVYLAMGATAVPALKMKTLEYAMSEMKLQDFFYPMHSVSTWLRGLRDRLEVVSG